VFNDDEVRYLDGTIFDVTDQQRAEDAIHKLNQDLERRVQERTVELRAAVAALRESEDRFRDLAESASDWFWEIGADLRVTYVSDRIREVAGVEPSSIIGVHVRDLPTVNHEDSDWNAYMDALEERRPFRGLICQRRVDDGSIRSFQFSGRPVFDNEGEFLGFRCVATDLTARVRAEEALRQARDELEQRVEQRTAELKEANEQLKREIAEHKQAEDALRESEARYQAVVEDQTELISRHTPDGNRTFVNEAYCRFHGKSRDELIGRSAYEALAPEELDRLKALYARLTP
jgi:PAS domain S-box-containing protein